MPSSFTRVLSCALVFSTCPPVSVCGTVLNNLCLVTFPGSLASATSDCLRSLVVASQFNSTADFPTVPPYSLKPEPPISGWPSLLRPHLTAIKSTGIFTRFPSTTPLGLALGADSPCADERCAGNLGLSASGPFTRFIATHVSIRTSDTSSIPLETPSQAYRTLPYHLFRDPQLRLLA